MYSIVSWEFAGSVTTCPNVTDDRLTRVASFTNFTVQKPTKTTAMANCVRWPTYKSGQLHKFYCTKTNKNHSHGQLCQMTDLQEWPTSQVLLYQQQQIPQPWSTVTDDRLTRVANFTSVTVPTPTNTTAMANCDRRPTYTGWQLHKSYCTNTNKNHSQELRETLAATHTNVAKIRSSFKWKSGAISHIYFTNFLPTYVEVISTHS